MNATLDDALHLIASRLKEARRKKYPSAAAAARALGMNEVTVRAHEAGQNGIPMDVMVRYVRAYDVDFNWLLRGHRASVVPVDKDGVSLPVKARISPGLYVDPNVEQPELPALRVPAADRFFGFEVYIMDSDEWATVAPLGSHLVCTPADSVMLRRGDLVVVQRSRADLIQLSLWRLGFTRSGEAGLVDQSGKAGPVLSGPEADPQIVIAALVRQIVTDLPRAPIDETLPMDLPRVAREPEPL